MNLKRLLHRLNPSLNNIIPLGLIQVGNSLIPLIIYPFVLVKIGNDEFSNLVLSEVFGLYLLSISLYSFDVNGIGKIISHEKLNIYLKRKIFWNILYTRLIVYVISFTFFSVIVFLFFNQILLSFFLWALFPLGMILQSNYYFQAIQKNKIFSLFVLSSRITTCILIFSLIDNQSTKETVILILTSGYLLSGLLSINYIIFHFKLQMIQPSYKYIRTYIYDGFYIFLSNISVSFFRSSNVLILSIIGVNSSSISLYAIAEKYIKLLQATARPINQAYFPIIVEKLSVNLANPLKLLWQNTKPQLIYMALASSLFFAAILTDLYVFQIFFNKHLTILILIMIGAVFFGIGNFVFGVVGLNELKKSKLLFHKFIITGVVSFIICFTAGYFYGAYGAAFAYLFSETMLFGLILFTFFKNK